jgi:hypothetical protein
MNKISLIAAIGTIVLLYLIGFIADIPYLALNLSPSYTEISFIPIVAEILIALISERIVKMTS